MNHHELTRLPIGDHHAVYGTEADILALHAMLKQRFQDGREVGRAEALDEQSHTVTPEERGETPLPLAG